MEEIEITVLDQTAEALRSLSEAAGAPTGEIVDRLMLQMAPKDPQAAFLLIMEQLMIGISNLSESDASKVLGELGGTLFYLIPPEELDAIVSKVKSEEYAKENGLRPLPAEERSEILKVLRESLFSEGN